MALWVTRSIVETAVERRVYEDPNNWSAIARFCTDIEKSYEFRSGLVPVDDNGVAYCKALRTQLIWHYPGYVQNYIFSYVTEAQLYDALWQQWATRSTTPGSGHGWWRISPETAALRLLLIASPLSRRVQSAQMLRNGTFRYRYRARLGRRARGTVSKATDTYSWCMESGIGMGIGDRG